jgi:transcriptional regulator with GAF, ATPase, and Fis domain
MKAKRLPDPTHYFKCAHCSQDFTLESFRFAAILYGLIFLVGKDYGYVGIVCPNCLKTTVERKEKRQIINVKKELGEEINIVDLVNKNGSLQPEILTSNETKNAIKNHTIETIIYQTKLKYSTFGQDPYEEDIKPYTVLTADGFIPFQGSKYAMTMTQKQINSTVKGNDIFVSYIAKSKILEDLPFFLGSEEKNINAIVKLENDSRKKIFPRYYYSNSILESCINFYDNQYLEFIERPDLIVNVSKHSLLKHIDLLKILEKVAEEKKNRHLTDCGVYQVLWRTKHPFKGIGVPQFISDSVLERLLGKKKQSQVKNGESILKIWSKFAENNIQNILSKKSFEFAMEINDLAKRIDFSNFMLFNLQRKYLKDIHESIVSPDKIQKTPKSVTKAFNKAKNEIGIEIISQDSKIMENVINIVDFVKKKIDMPEILILGETGTGKELIAETYQKATGKECITINSSAIPESQIESELFGHAKGAFTGAEDERKGAFLSADKGIIFLDEIGDIGLAAQAKLLRVIENRKIKPLGKDTIKEVTVDIIMATNKDLSQLIKEGKFREDLYHRINKFVFKIPPLRERREDIPLLLTHFIDEFDKDRKDNKDLPKLKFSTECIKYIQSLDWPGNVRSLRSMVEIVVANRLRIKNRGEITLSDIPEQTKESLLLEKTSPSKKQDNKKELTAENITKALMDNNNVKAAAARQLGYSREHFSRVYNTMRKKGQI